METATLYGVMLASRTGNCSVSIYNATSAAVVLPATSRCVNILQGAPTATDSVVMPMGIAMATGIYCSLNGAGVATVFYSLRDR